MPADGRVAWFDYAKGICILLVVMMHSTLGVGEAFGEAGLPSEGFMHYVVAFAQPFRMPDFMLLAGLFLSFAIGRGWLHYLDKKLVHFAYFYLLWTLIVSTVKLGAKGDLSAGSLGTEIIQSILNPNPVLWFIYVLPLMFIATKLLRWVPGPILLVAAALLQALPVHTGWIAIDHYLANYYVFFLCGYLLAPHVFAIADWAAENVKTSIVLVAAWALLNGLLVATPSPIEGWANVSQLPIISLILGGLGAMAVVTISSLLSKFDVARFIRYCGQNSIVIYISFTIPMATLRTILLKTGVITDVGWVSLIVWVTAVVSPLILLAMVRWNFMRFLFVRPHWFSLPYEKTVSDERARATRVPGQASA
ncbi:MAG: acyltransferase family protein [Alphaproteobacteria bacterium]|nr:acyltransferase family protein [Alphaproteobacteria bacterium]